MGLGAADFFKVNEMDLEATELRRDGLGVAETRDANGGAKI